MTPGFDPAVISYETSTSDATNKITAVAARKGASVSIEVNGEPHTNETAAAWEDGANTVAITVRYGTTEQVYTVSVTKS